MEKPGSRTLQRKWVWLQWGALLAMLASLLPVYLGKSPVLTVLLLAFSMGGSIVSTRKLRCPYCRKGMPWNPRPWPSKRTERCRVCGRPLLFDDQRKDPEASAADKD